MGSEEIDQLDGLFDQDDRDEIELVEFVSKLLPIFNKILDQLEERDQTPMTDKLSTLKGELRPIKELISKGATKSPQDKEELEARERKVRNIIYDIKLKELKKYRQMSSNKVEDIKTPSGRSKPGGLKPPQGESETTDADKDKEERLVRMAGKIGESLEIVIRGDDVIIRKRLDYAVKSSYVMVSKEIEEGRPKKLEESGAVETASTTSTRH